MEVAASVSTMQIYDFPFFCHEVASSLGNPSHP